MPVTSGPERNLYPCNPLIAKLPHRMQIIDRKTGKNPRTSNRPEGGHTGTPRSKPAARCGNDKRIPSDRS
jgi:hypothetical protein